MKPAPIVLVLAVFGLASCDWMPGRPKPSDKWQAPHANLDFRSLYAQNCQGCHGIDGSVAGSISLDNPTYLAVVDRETLVRITANGTSGIRSDGKEDVSGNMPAFADFNGGILTIEQIGVIADELLAKRPAQSGGPLPAHSAPLGSVAAGREAFGIFCASCHGADGNGGSAGSVVQPAYLALVSDQYLRTVTIAGRPELGCPDFRTRVPGREMQEEEIAGVVAWLASNRRNEFGARQAPVPAAPAQPTEPNQGDDHGKQE